MYRERIAGSGKNKFFEIILIDCNKAEMTKKGNSE
jgi:ribosomal protein L15E